MEASWDELLAGELLDEAVHVELLCTWKLDGSQLDLWHRPADGPGATLTCNSWGMLDPSDDGSSPFARERFALLSPEEKDAVIAKRRRQRAAAEALDRQLQTAAELQEQRRARRRRRQQQQQQQRRRWRRSSEHSPSPERRSPELRRATPPGSPERSPTDVERVAWWHEPDARRGSPPARRRSGRELLRDPEEKQTLEAQRRKKLQVGEGLRAQMQERDAQLSASREVAPAAQAPQQAALAAAAGQESEERLDSTRLARGEAAAAGGVPERWVSRAEHEQLQQQVAQMELRMEQQANRMEQLAQQSSGASALGAVAELRAEMATVRGDHTVLSDDLDSCLRLISQLDDVHAGLQLQLAEMASRYSERHASPGEADIAQMRDDLARLSRELSAQASRPAASAAVAASAGAELHGQRIASLEARLESELAALHQATSEDRSGELASLRGREAELAQLPARLGSVEQRQLDDRAHIDAQLGSLKAQLASQRETAQAAHVGVEESVASLEARLTSVVGGVAQDNAVGVRLSELQEAAEARSEAVDARLAELAAEAEGVGQRVSASVEPLAHRVEALERGRETDLSDLSQKLSGVEEKQWDDIAALEEQLAALEARVRS